MLTMTTVIATHCFLMLTFTFTIADRVSPLHLLARYPGPLVCKVSKGWIAYVSSVRGTTRLYMQSLHQRNKFARYTDFPSDGRWILHVPWTIPYLWLILGGSQHAIKQKGDITAKRRLELVSTQKDLFYYSVSLSPS